MESDTLTVTALVTVAVALTKVIEILIGKLFNKNGSSHTNGNGSNGNGNHKIDAVIAWQNVRDQNGVPMGYFPRSIIDTQEKIASSLHESLVLQGKVIDELSRVTNSIERFSDKVDRRLDDIEGDFLKIQKTVNGNNR